MASPNMATHSRYMTQPSQDDNSAWDKEFPGAVFYHGPEDRKLAALSFDDAPDSLFIPLYLSVLAQENVKATFFCLGNCIAKNPGSLIRIAEQGHIIANHTWDHVDITKAAPEQVREEIRKTEDEIERLTGQRTGLFRPPYGAINAANIRLIISLGYRIIMWNIDSLDWMGLTGPMIASRVIPSMTPGAISLMHNACEGTIDAGTGTTQSLPYIIKTLKAAGYTFTTIPELLNIPAYQ